MLEYYPLISLPDRKIAALIVFKNTDNNSYVSANDSIYGTAIPPKTKEEPTNNSNVVNLFGKK